MKPIEVHIPENPIRVVSETTTQKVVLDWGTNPALIRLSLPEKPFSISLVTTNFTGPPSINQPPESKRVETSDSKNTSVVKLQEILELQTNIVEQLRARGTTNEVPGKLVQDLEKLKASLQPRTQQWGLLAIMNMILVAGIIGGYVKSVRLKTLETNNRPRIPRAISIFEGVIAAFFVPGVMFLVRQDLLASVAESPFRLVGFFALCVAAAMIGAPFIDAMLALTCRFIEKQQLRKTEEELYMKERRLNNWQAEVQARENALRRPP